MIVLIPIKVTHSDTLKKFCLVKCLNGNTSGNHDKENKKLWCSIRVQFECLSCEDSTHLPLVSLHFMNCIWIKSRYKQNTSLDSSFTGWKSNITKLWEISSHKLQQSPLVHFCRQAWGCKQGQWLSEAGARINMKRWLPPQLWPDSDRSRIVEHIPPLFCSRHDTGILVPLACSLLPLSSKQAFLRSQLQTHRTSSQQSSCCCHTTQCFAMLHPTLPRLSRA